MSKDNSRFQLARQSARSWHAKYIEASQTNQSLQSELARWKTLAEQLPDEDQAKDFLRQIKDLKRQLRDTEEKSRDKIAQLERDKLLLEGRIQQLEESRKDLQERYSELKDDFRWIKGEKVKAKKIAG